MRRRASLLVLAALTVLTCSCGTVEVDPAEAERKIARDYERQVEGVTVRSVTCPGRIDAEPGTKATCTMRLTDGRSGRIDVEVVDDVGNLRWDVAEAPR